MEMRGRPTLFTTELADSICEKISQGITLTEILDDEGMPGRTTVYDWMNDVEDDDKKAFSERFARARDVGFDVIAEQCLDIADTPLEGEEVTTDNEGKVSTKTGDMLGHRKLQIETRLKLLAKWNPKKYGDKVQNEHSGGIEFPAIMILPTNGRDSTTAEKEGD